VTIRSADPYTLRFYATPEHECSYLPNQRARTLFLDPRVEVDSNLYSQLSELGFRRSGEHIYRPYCERCQACISVRVPVAEFRPSKTQRRIENRNADLSVRAVPCQLTREYYALYERYINQRHADGDMYPPSPDQFFNFLVEGTVDACFYEFRDPQGTLLAVAVSDLLVQGMSALYTFYDPQAERRSLGVYAIIWQIRHTARSGKKWLYLGYWVEACRKMNYKIRYRPLELLIDGQWCRRAPE
jgi:arginine-tRNA-protein transferase